ncbi:MAG: aminotransferase class V-fold PLP-dependent enzyme [Bacteroidota bacterium]
MTTHLEKELDCQRHLFHLADDNGFLNGAYMSPQLKAVHAAGVHALQGKNDPTSIAPEDFFTPVTQLKKSFAELVDCSDHERIALIPAVSYGVAIVAKNLVLERGQNIVVAGGQFPSNYYAWAEKCKAVEAELRVIKRPDTEEDVQASWNELLLNAIDENTALLALSHIHWADGTLWNLKALRAKTSVCNAWLLIDGTQSVGALPFSIREVQPDALICAGYKWLMGPYGTAYAYLGPVFDEGRPLEENWINRHNSHDFRQLVNYQDQYRPKAARYSVGEQSNFLLIPMQIEALRQLNAWGIDRIQDYCAGLWQPILSDLARLGVSLPAQRAHHLVGLRLPKHLNTEQLPTELAKRRLSVSFRGDAIRVAPNVYNRVDEMVRLVDAIAAVG